MTRVRVLLSRLAALVRGRQMEREFDDEIASHLEEATDEYMHHGLSFEEAHRAAVRDFGSHVRAREVYRQMRAFGWVDEPVRDVRYAVRALRHSAAFTTTATTTLAFAIGANVAMFSIVNAVLLRPLPYRSPEQLATLWTDDPARNILEGRSALSDVEQWRSQSTSFADLATFDSVSAVLSRADGAEQIQGASISPNLLPLLGVDPVRGRNFSLDEAERRQRVVLISHSFWHTRWGGRRERWGIAWF